MKTLNHFAPAFCQLCFIVLLLASSAAWAKTMVVDGSAVKTISAALAMLDRNDGEADVINVTAPVVIEPGQVTLTGKDSLTLNLNAGGSPSRVVFPKSVAKAGFLLAPPMLETPCSYTLQNGVIVPQFEPGLTANDKAAILFQPADGSINFSVNLKNLTLTASAEENVPVPVLNAYSKSNTHWSHGLALAPGTLNNLTEVSVNISQCIFSQLDAYGLNLSYANANPGGLKINVTDTQMIKSNPENSRPMGTWATGGIVVNMTRTELADFKVMLFECLVGTRAFEWNLNEGCSIHDFSQPPFLVWPDNINEPIAIHFNGTPASPVQIYNNRSVCFDLGGGRQWNKRFGFSLTASHVQFSNNTAVLMTDWVSDTKPAPIHFKFSQCEFKDNGDQALAFSRGRFTAAFSGCHFQPAPGGGGMDLDKAGSESGTGELEFNGGVITPSPSLPTALAAKKAVSAEPFTQPDMSDLVSRSPENQVFQFMTKQEFTPDPAKFRPQATTAYLWIPPACARVRGVLVFGYNVPEHWLVGHSAIRNVCTEKNLAILFTSGSFRLCAVCADGKYAENLKAKAHVDFLQQIMEALAKESGYEELSTAPWLPMGESMSLMIVTHLVNGAPERCIAGIHIKDGVWDPIKPATVPLLEACGTAAEWGHEEYDLATRWQDMAVDDLENHVAKRTAMPAWPGSLLIEAGSAHFSVTEPMGRYLADYIRAAASARLSADGSPALRPVDLNSGYVAGLATPAAAPIKPKKYSESSAGERNLPWYFNRDLAQAAYDLANINWAAQSPEPVFADLNGRPLPFNKSGIFDIPCVLESDGITFTLNSTFLEKLPATSWNGRSPLGHPDDKPAIEWVCGPVIPLGANRFQIALDRTGNQEVSAILRVIHSGDATYRLSINPGFVKVGPNRTGKAQKISFDPIPDQKVDVKEIQLHAVSDSGLPVRFYVKAGPAEIHGDRLVFTGVPTRAKLPLTVTVGAWQWGRAAEPAIQTAKPVEQKFQMIP